MTKIEILGKGRDNLLKELKFLEDFGFYLAGGTALALQIEHRTSLDFDFYSKKKFDNKKLLQKLEKRFKQIKLVQNPEQTLTVKINGISVSFFHYPYLLLCPLVELKDCPPMASLKDIAAMKLIAIIQRGTRRDFIDIYFLIKKLGLKTILSLAKRKYPSFNIYLSLQALSFFEDAGEKGKGRRTFVIEDVSWSEVKKSILEAVNNFKKEHLK